MPLDSNNQQHSTTNNMKFILLALFGYHHTEIVTPIPTNTITIVDQYKYNTTHFNEGEFIGWKKYIQNK